MPLEKYDLEWQSVIFNPLNAGSENTQGLNLVITVHADVLAPKGARPSAGTVLTKKLRFFQSFSGIWSFSILCIFFPRWDDGIQNNQQDVAKSLKIPKHLMQQRAKEEAPNGVAVINP